MRGGDKVVYFLFLYTPHFGGGGGGGGGTYISGVTGIPLFYYWVPYYHGGGYFLMVGTQPFFNDWITTSPRAVS